MKMIAAMKEEAKSLDILIYFKFLTFDLKKIFFEVKIM